MSFFSKLPPGKLCFAACMPQYILALYYSQQAVCTFRPLTKKKPKANANFLYFTKEPKRKLGENRLKGQTFPVVLKLKLRLEIENQSENCNGLQIAKKIEKGDKI